MELSKSKIKVKDGRRLYFNRFSYKVHFETEALYYTYWANDINEFRNQIDLRVLEQVENKFSFRRKIDPATVDYDLIEKYLVFREKYKHDSNLIIFRREGDGAAIYTDDHNIINEFLAFSPNSQITRVVPMPSGVIQFKKEPPAAYRVYFKTTSHPGSVRQDLIDYLDRTPDMDPNFVLLRALGQEWPMIHFHNGQYLNYNDDRNLLMMHILFPGILGKTYKLEKK